MTTNVGLEQGGRLQEERRRLGHTQADFAELLRVSKSTQSNYETGFRSPDSLYLHSAAGAGLDVLYVVTGRRSTPVEVADTGDLVRIERLEPRGTGEVLPAFVSVSRAWLASRHLSPATLRTVQVRGASMQGVLADGDLAFIDQADVQPQSGFMYAMLQSAQVVVKHCEPLPGGLLRISSANTAFPPYDVDPNRAQDFRVLGRVVASMHDW